MKKHFCSLPLLLALITQSSIAQDHGHLNVGALGTNQNDQLAFDESEIFDTDSDYVKTLTFTNGSTYAGYYQGNITLTALSANPSSSAYSPNAPATGSYIFAELSSVEGPAGGEFAFWDTGATNPTINLISGTTGTNRWRLTEADGSPGSDPYGHIHGRRFTATKPGVYVVGFRALDLSTNGINAGTIHTPSSVLKVYFQAGDNIRSIEPDVDHTHIHFAARAGYTWLLQANSSFATNGWGAVGAPVIGDDYFHEVLDEVPVEGTRVYRIVGSPYLP